MQRIKYNTRHLLLETAREAFLEKGFKSVSMREISEKSGVGLSNIYNYFRNKDELLKTVLKPLLKAFEEVMSNHSSEENTTIDIFTSKDYQRNTIHDFVTFIARFRKELKLLLFAAQGSCFENYRETLIERNTKTGLQYMNQMKERYPRIHGDISSFFIHITSSWWVGILEEIASHDELSDAEVECFISEYVCFGTAGWQALMKV